MSGLVSTIDAIAKRSRALARRAFLRETGLGFGGVGNQDGEDGERYDYLLNHGVLSRLGEF